MHKIYDMLIHALYLQAQYTFIYDVLFEAVLSGNTACSTIPAGNTACSGAAFRKRFAELLEDFNISTEYDNPSSEIGEQFEVLQIHKKTSMIVITSIL